LAPQQMTYGIINLLGAAKTTLKQPHHQLYWTTLISPSHGQVY
jgi:hypothetical protein